MRTVEFKITILEAKHLPEIKDPSLETSKKKGDKKKDAQDWKRVMSIRFGKEHVEEDGSDADDAFDRSPNALVDQWETVGVEHIFEKNVDESFLNEILVDRNLLTFEIYKAKDENNLTACIGTASLNLDPLIRDFKTRKLDEWLPVDIDTSALMANSSRPGTASSRTSRPGTAASAGKDKDSTQGSSMDRDPPELHVQLCINDCLVSPEDQSEGNICRVQLGQMQNLPTTWEPKEGQSISDHVFEYLAEIHVPLNDTLTKKYQIGGGRMYMRFEEDDNDENDHEMQGNEKNAADSPLGKFIIVWEKPDASFFLGNAAMERLESMASKGDPLRLELRRIIRSDYRSEGWTDENEKCYRADLQVTMEKLMYPGECTVHEISKLAPHKMTEDEMAARPATGKKKPSSSTAKKGKKSPPPELSLVEPEYADGEHPYEMNGTRLAVSVMLDTPIIPLLKDRPRPSLKPSDVIPTRKRIEKKVSAVERYRKEIAAVVDMLAEEYARLKNENPAGTVDREEFIFELNNRGIYFAFKDKIKKTVCSIVHEKFSNVQGAERRDVDKFYNDLYLFLMKQMHSSVNAVFNEASDGDQLGDKEIILGIDGSPVDKWKRLSDEAEFASDYALAERYQKQRITNSPENHVLWYEYALFCMRANDLEKAEHALKEAIAFDMAHLESLQVYGTLLCARERFTEAEVFLQSAIDLDSENSLSWGLLRLYFDLVEKSKESHQAELYAERTLVEATAKMNESADGTEPHKTIGIVVAQFLLMVHVHTLTERVLLEEVRRNDNSEQTHLLFAQMYMVREDFQRAENHCLAAIKLNHRSMDAWKYLGNVRNVMRRVADEEQAYETALSVAGKETVTDAVLYLRLGHLYLQGGKLQDAKDMYLQAAKYWPSATSWLGVSMAYFALDDLVHSEQSLNEANVQNNLNPDVWGYLCMVCIRTGRYQEAERSLRESLRLKLKNINILESIVALYEDKAMSNEAAFARQALERL